MKKYTLNAVLIILCLSVQAQMQNPYGTIVEDYTGQKYDTSGGSLITYNEVGDVISIVNRTYNQVTNKWNNNSRYDYTVNADGNRSHFTFLAWSISSNSWDTLSGFFVNWISPEQRTYSEVWTYNNGKQNLSLDSHIYSANNVEILTKTHWWNSSKKKYEYLGFTNYIYNSAGMVTSRQSHWLDTVNQKWDTTGRVLYSYNTHMLQDSVLSQSYTNNGLRNDNLSVYLYDAEDKKAITYYLVNDGTIKGLENKYKTEYTYHADGRENVSNNYTWNVFNLEFDPYYRITNLYKDFTGIDQHSNLQLFIYPNPTSNKINIDVPMEYMGSTLFLISQEGRLVHQAKVNNDHVELDISDQPSGCYFLMIQEIDGSTSRSMVIKK